MPLMVTRVITEEEVSALLLSTRIYLSERSTSEYERVRGACEIISRAASLHTHLVS